jgi:hypothetical protein
MGLETLLFGLLLAGACFPVAVAGRLRPVAVILVVSAGLLVGISSATAWTRWKTQAVHERLALDRRPVEIEQDGYVSSRTCESCHPSEHATWHASYHRRMTQFATPETVLAPFDGEELVGEDGVFRALRRGDEFWIEMTAAARGPGDLPHERVSRRVVMLTGSHHYQVYWYPGPNPRVVWVAPYIWLIEEQRWIPRGAAFLGPEERTKNILGVWNNSCIKCHSTRGLPRPDEHGGWDTRVAEIGIACEACHGPAEEHVLLHRDPRRRYRLHLNDGADSSIVQPGRLDHRKAAQVCAQCHSVWRHTDAASAADWMRNGLSFRPGDELTDTVDMVRPGANGERMGSIRARHPTYRMDRQFWRDGMVRVSGREYNGLLETPCFQKGHLTCVSCHRLHKKTDDPRSMNQWNDDQLAAGMRDDEACLQCHDKYREQPEKHTFHKPESSGSACYNCHMPYTTYGLLKAIRSHQIDSPTVGASLRTGRPNACNQCHLDKTLAWSAEYLEKWYDLAAPRLGIEHREIAASVVWTLRGDAGQRALMAWSMGWEPAQEISGTGWMAPYLAQLLEDPYQAVRLMAHRSLVEVPGFESFDYDFLASPEQRSAARRRAVQQWRRLPGKPQDELAGPLLIDDQGRLREDRFLPLLARRDDRVVELHE